MEDSKGGWVAFDAELPILTCEYSFGPSTANALAVRGAQGMIVVSPPWRAKPVLFDGVARYGGVRALVAPNAFHTLGVGEWKARFPEADVFAPAQSIARLLKRTGVATIRPIEEIGPVAGARVLFIDMPHYRTGEALLRIDAARGTAWYVTDAIFNMQVLPSNPIARFVFKASGSAPGLRFNNVGALFMVKDKRALRQWLAGEFARQKPRWLIPAHGPPVDVEAQRADVRALFPAA